MRKNFIPNNDSFSCDVCQKEVPPAKGTFRNHCPHCLTSKHVDEVVPGDRASKCHGLMPTLAYEGTDPQYLDLVQQCRLCGKEHRNRTAPDDNVRQLFEN